MIVHAQEKGATVTRAADNAAIARRFIEKCVNKGDMAVADDVLAVTFVRHGPSIAVEPRGAEGITGDIVMLRMAFPDLHATMCDIVAEGDRVVAYLWMGGTNTGSYRGMPATGTYATWKAITTMRVVDGHIAELWGLAACSRTLTTLGLIPEET